MPISMPSSLRRGAVAASLAVAVAVPAALQPATAGARDDNCTIKSTRVDDVVRGTPHRDIICARGGDDLIFGRGGNDRIYGGSGDNRIFGGSGNDQLIGGSDRDRLFGNAGDDRLFGRLGTDLYRGGPGDDDSADGRRLKEVKNHTVYLHPTWDVPAGTTLKINYLGGNCTKNEVNRGPFPVPTQGSMFILTGRGGAPWESCAYERSYAWFRFDFVTPGGLQRSSTIQVRQASAPTIFLRTYEVQCEGTEIGCEGGSDTSFGDDVALRVPVKFGPLTDVPPEPKPNNLICGGTFHLSVGDTLKDQHVCTSEGVPTPELTFRGLPEGVKASRWPTANDTWIVVNGRITKPGFYQVWVDARQGGPPQQEPFNLEVSD